MSEQYVGLIRALLSSSFVYTSIVLAFTGAPVLDNRTLLKRMYAIVFLGQAVALILFAIRASDTIMIYVHIFVLVVSVITNAIATHSYLGRGIRKKLWL